MTHTPMSSEWMDIETAPKDKNVLVLDAGFVSECYFNSESGKWWLANTAEHDFDHEDQIYPTHWMPIPEPPVMP